jgi:hypothetical protein
VTIARLCAGPIVGIDVGEDFLDLAIVDAAARQVRLARVAVRGIERVGDVKDCAAISELRRRLIAAAPELGANGTIALIDSPRWPRDLDLAAVDANRLHGQRDSAASSASRAIDRTLRAIVGAVALRKPDGGPFRLSLFPTPRFEFFAACVCDPHCKPHLAALGRELFGAMIDHANAGIAPAGGRIFTRFMIAGFAAYRAIQDIGAESYEAYPDLAFRLWADGVEIPPKSAGRVAFEARVVISRGLADEMGYAGAQAISTLDEADAAVLALSAAQAERKGVIAVIQHRGEGRFGLALNADQARRVELMRPDSH